MAIISKALSTPGRNACVKGLISGGWSGGGQDIGAITKIAAKTSSGEGDGVADQDITWGAVASGAASISSSVAITVPAGNTITYIALIALDSGSFADYVNMALVNIDSELFTYQGSITITSCTVTQSATLT